jgi:hypothetical protein
MYLMASMTPPLIPRPESFTPQRTLPQNSKQGQQGGSVSFSFQDLGSRKS